MAGNLNQLRYTDKFDTNKSSTKQLQYLPFRYVCVLGVESKIVWRQVVHAEKIREPSELLNDSIQIDGDPGFFQDFILKTGTVN